MNVRVILLVFLAACFTGAHFQNHPPPAQGYEKVNFRNQGFVLFHVDLNRDSMRFFWRNENQQPIRSLGKLEQACASKDLKLAFATNGGMYLENRHPQGWYVEDGVELKAPNRVKEAYGNFYLQPNGFFALTDGGPKIGPTPAIVTLKPKVNFATQSGPLLLIDGALHPAFREGSKNRYIRSGVGITGPNQVVFAISDKPVNFYDFACLFRDRLRCRNALYLDGAISRMHVPEVHPDKGGNFGCMIGVVRPTN
ncbi:MAG: phosphodiester glycosidase family protein [Salibacteraceae bacterium]